MTDIVTTASEKLVAVREQLVRQGLDGFLVTRADRFQGEEVRPEDEVLAWLSGFTGSAGMALILHDKAVLASDSRYTVQMALQTDAALYETIDIAECPLKDWMAACSADGRVVIGYDSWAVTKAGLDRLPAHLGGAQIDWRPVSEHPVEAVWADRPASRQTALFSVDEAYTGLNAAEKIQAAVSELKRSGHDLQFISAPDIMMWLTNLRGQDLEFTPVHLCFGILSAADGLVFISDNAKVPEFGYKTVAWAELAAYLSAHSGRTIACDPVSLPLAVQNYLERAGLKPVFKTDLLMDKKARKTPAEVDGFRQAHLLDGLALSRFFCWLERQADRSQLSETELGRRLTAFRAANDGYICDSFSTIAGWRDHGAIVHYRAEDGKDYRLSGPGVLLLDSGAHYTCGTTDITRTVFLGRTAVFLSGTWFAKPALFWLHIASWPR